MENKVTIEEQVIAARLPIFVCNLAPIMDQLHLARQAIEDVRAMHPDSTPSNVRATYMSPWMSHELSTKFAPLCASTLTIARTCAPMIGGIGFNKLNLDLAVNDCWGAIYENSDFASRHNHFPADFAAVIYLEVQEDCAPLVFCGEIAVHPKPATLILFPGILDHEVPPKAGRRVVVAMNLYKRLAFVAKT